MKRAYGGLQAIAALKHLGLEAIGEALETKYVVIEIDEPERTTPIPVDEVKQYIQKAEEYVQKHKVDHATWGAILEGIPEHLHDDLPPNLERIRKQYATRHRPIRRSRP